MIFCARYCLRHKIDDKRSETDCLDGLLKDAIGKQMVADVPLGAFLSGDFDSSTVAALMQTQSSRPVKPFTIGFGIDDYNEVERPNH